MNMSTDLLSLDLYPGAVKRGQAVFQIKYLAHYDKDAWGPLAYAKDGDAGFDLRAVVPVDLAPGERRLVPTGVAVAVPAGYELQVRSRSGMALRNGLVVANGVGTIDAGYRGEVGIILHNIGRHSQTVHYGDRIAQGVLSAVPRMYFVEVDELPDSVRGSSGYGSSGTN
jgi:dUTP pyrophosphatase